MRRLLSILLLAVFALPLFAPLLLEGQSAEASLPACCRRNGKHHCAMNMAERLRMASSQKQFTGAMEKCPYAPASVAPAHPHLYALPTAQAVYAGVTASVTATAQTESKQRIARDRSRLKRGPPSEQIPS